MKFSQLIKFFACASVVGGLSILSACKKDSMSVVASVKCDYAPYAKGSKFVYTTNTPALATDTITGDTAINGVGYAKVLSTGVSGNGVPTKTIAYTRCDANGVFILLDKASVGGTDITNFTGKEIQPLKLPASVGLTWKSDTIKYTASGINVALLYKMTETAVGGSKLANGTTYSNSLVTVQIKTYSTYTYLGTTTIDSSLVTTNVFDKTVGTVEIAQNGTVSKSLKSSIIK
jgi:hypothetical protein